MLMYAQILLIEFWHEVLMVVPVIVAPIVVPVPMTSVMIFLRMIVVLLLAMAT